MDSPKRKHGGRRTGAGRPIGATSTLGHGEVNAVKSLRWRVPEEAPEPVAEVADEAFARIVEVMRGQVSTAEGHAAAILKAATQVRHEVCGAPTQKAEVSGPGGEALTIEIRKYGKDDE